MCCTPRLALLTVAMLMIFTLALLPLVQVAAVTDVGEPNQVVTNVKLVQEPSQQLRGSGDVGQRPPLPSVESRSTAPEVAPAALSNDVANTGSAGGKPTSAPIGMTNSVRLEAFARSLLAGLSTSLGAAVVLLLRGQPTPAQMAFCLALAGGVMITVSIVELFMPLLQRPDEWLFGGTCAGLGALAFLALTFIVPEPSYTGEDAKDKDKPREMCNWRDGGQLHEVPKGGVVHRAQQWRLAVLLTVALTAHNFPEGLAVAVSSLQSERLGLVVMVAIAVHNIPEGIAIAMPVLDATGNRWQAMKMATLSGLAEPLGAIFALELIPKEVLQGRGMDGLLCVVGGIMTCVAFVELLPEAHHQKQPVAALLGFVAGVMVMMMTHELA
eukprot:gnl/TRDRNA2_/TRDRNA2_67329_c0_seq1.p1 gnl/TRDRNA2_/TRDRNA2_67329_c0~~gnl/TRDRNA2_/TRDRNA2_67329_c0_seq1.p1  ORF type:complete len:383 (-),score=78.64 gnl/TRDRNA2_/TRDRNA2_67329_c0_seq1:110-1258(-)